jgi:hypothetical protein
MQHNIIDDDFTDNQVIGGKCSYKNIEENLSC